MKTNNTSGIMGVSFHKASRGWKGVIQSNNKVERRYFKEKEEAIEWRKAKEKFYGFHKNHGK